MDDRAVDFLHDVENLRDFRFDGWIASTEDPERRFTVALTEGTRILSRAVACAFRADLLARGLGDGCYGFSLRVPLSLRDAKEHRLDIVEVGTGRMLTATPWLLRPATVAEILPLRGGADMLLQAGLPPSSRPSNGVLPGVDQTLWQRRFPPISRVLALIATRNHLPYAKLTARTFLQHHPHFSAFLLMVDGEPGDAALFPEGRTVFLSDLGLRNAACYRNKFDAAQFANALKPVFLQYLRGFAATAIYLDSDIAVFSRMHELIDLLESSDLVLVPHMLTPAPQPERLDVHPSRADTYCAGLINGGCLALNLAHCGKFLTLWQEMNFAPGAFYGYPVPQTDQQHLNWALVVMPGVAVLRSTRYNVAYWNLHERNLRLESVAGDASRFEVDGEPLAFFHFSGYDVTDRLCISRHDQRHSVYNFPGVADLLNWYSDRILDCPTAGLLHEPYRFDRLANGFKLNRFVRGLLQKYEPYVPRVDGQTVEGADQLCAFLMDPLPAAGSLLPLIAAEIHDMRSGLQQAFPGAQTAANPAAFLAWFFMYAGTEHDVQFLIDRFRRPLICDSLLALTAEIRKVFGKSPLAFLGADRTAAAARLIALDRIDLAHKLLEARDEWTFFTDVDAALTIHLRRPGLHDPFPDILGRNHEAYLEWLTKHGAEEHGYQPSYAERFRGRTAAACLPRIFSYLSRDESLGVACERFLLADDPDPLLRQLVRAAGEGYEFDLDDVAVLRFVHRRHRHLLVPLYLELPIIRRRDGASRMAESSVSNLPEAIRSEAWARHGCDVHAAHFNEFDAVLDAEARRWGARLISPTKDVIDFLRAPKDALDPIGMIEPVFRYAARLARDEAAVKQLDTVLEERRVLPGVNVFGHFASDTGVGESSRGLANAISRLRPVNRVPFCTYQLRKDTELSALFQRFDYLTDTNVFITYPHQREDLLGRLRPEQAAGRRNIAHLAWEQRDVNPWWKQVYDRYDEIWTLSEFSATGFRTLFPGRVKVVPNVLNADEFPEYRELREGRLKGERIQFLFVFDAGSSIERKNPSAVIEAFVKAFRGTAEATRVQLTLKASGLHRPQFGPAVDRLRQQAAVAGLAIEFDGNPRERDTLLRLIAQADCYVSLHRSEGFGYTMAEAMYYGVPVIASGYSGNLDYMTEANSLLVPCREVFVKNAEGPFQHGSVWGEPDVDAAAAFMREVVKRPDEALARAELGRQSVVEKLSAATVAGTLQSSFQTPEPIHRATLRSSRVGATQEARTQWQQN